MDAKRCARRSVARDFGDFRVHERRDGIPEEAQRQSDQGGLSDRLLWESLYRALLMMAQAIKRYKLEPPAR